MVIKYFKTYKQLIRINISKEIQYRTNFIVSTLVSLLWGLVRVMFYVLAFDYLAVVDGWTKEQSIILASIFLCSQAIFKIFFEDNMSQFPYNLYNGDLDYILTKPISAQFLISTKTFIINAFLRFLIGVLIIILTLNGISWQFSLWQILIFIWLMILSIAITYSIHFINVCLAFWLGFIDNLHYFSRAFLNTSYLPISIYPKILTQIFTFIIPFAFIATIPAQSLFNPNLFLVIIGTILSVVFLFLTRIFWHLGLKSYSSVSN